MESIKLKQQKQKRKFLFSLKLWIPILLLVGGYLLVCIIGIGQKRARKDMRDRMALQGTLTIFCAEERRMPTGWKELEAKGLGRLVENGTRFYSNYLKREIVVKDYEIRFGLSKEDIEKMEKPILLHVKDKWYLSGGGHEAFTKVLLRCMREGRDLLGPIDEEADSATQKSVPRPAPVPSENLH